MKRTVPLLAVAGILLVVWALDRELRAIRPQEVVAYLKGLPGWKLAAALGLTALNYAILTGYDTLALRYAGYRLPYAKTAFASVLGFAFSSTLGHAVVTGGPVRYRLYSAWQVPGEMVARVIAFCGVAFWTGMLLLGGVVLILDPIPLATGFPISAGHLGWVLIALFLTYLVMNGARTRPFHLGRWSVAIPGVGLAVGQGLLASADLLVAAGVLWALLPAGVALTFGHFLSAFLLALLVGTASAIPGGWGVFDGLFLALLIPAVPAAQVVGALVAFRAVYFLLPLFLATGTLVAYEATLRASLTGKVVQTASAAREWLTRIVPLALAATTFLAGAVLLTTGAIGSAGGRFQWLGVVLPVGLVEIGHFSASVLGMALLILAGGLRRRLDAAWYASVILLAVAMLAALLRSQAWGPTLFLGVCLLLLLPAREDFDRKTRLVEDLWSPAWVAGILFVLLCTAWIGLFTFRGETYQQELWWRFALNADAPRFLRGLATSSVVLLMFVVVRLLRAPQVAPSDLEEPVLARVRTCVAAHGGPQASLVFLGDKHLLLRTPQPADPLQDGFVMYGAREGTLMAMGPPVGLPEVRDELAWTFKSLGRSTRKRVAFYQVAEEDLPLMLDLGLGLYKLGEEAMIPLNGTAGRPVFALSGGDRKSQRRAVKKLEDAGCTFEVVPADQTAGLLTELKRVSDAWMGEKSTREKGFSLGLFDEDYLRHFPMAIVRAAPQADGPGEIIAFANVTANDRLLGVPGGPTAPGAPGGPVAPAGSVAPGGSRAPSGFAAPGGPEEISLDLVRYDAARAPDSVMEALFAHMILWAQANGYQRFSLGMAPLSGLEPDQPEERALSPLWNRVGATLYRHGEHFYNFQGLRAYKSKFDPVWEPKYLAGPRSPLALPGVLLDASAIISGGLVGVISR